MDNNIHHRTDPAATPYGAHPVSSSAYFSGISWRAIAGGAVTATAISMVLGILGTGLGLTFISPYSGEGMSATGFTVHTAIWLIIMQWAASGLGGYVAGRLRDRSEGLHGDEVFFRDTANGFLSWALATVVTAMLLVSAASSAVAVSGHAASMAADQASEQQAGPYDGALNDMFCSEDANAAPVGASVRAEALRVVMATPDGESVQAADRESLSRTVSRQAGISKAEADARVDQMVSDVSEAKAQAKEAADKARKATATASIFTALSMFIGAFIAGVAGVIGGRHRDQY